MNEMIQASQQLHWFEFAGMAGFVLYVVGYLLLAMRRLTGDSTALYFINLLAASLVMLSLSNSFNLASVLIQTFWILISALGIARALRSTQAVTAEQSESTA